MKSQKVGYYISWTEYERGWGCRPDGYFIYPDPIVARKDTIRRVTEMRDREEKEYKGRVPAEYSAPDSLDNPKMTLLNDELAAIIEKQGWACVHHLPYRSDGTPNPYYRLN